MTRVVHIEGETNWFVSTTKSGTFMAACPSLKLVLEADTYAELSRTVEEGLGLLFEDLLEDGELEQFLRERSWRLRDPLPDDHAGLCFDIPFYLLPESSRGQQVAATQ